MPIVKTTKLITIERHITEEGAMHPDATGEFSHLLRDFTLAMRILARDVRRAGLMTYSDQQTVQMSTESALSVWIFMPTM